MVLPIQKIVGELLDAPHPPGCTDPLSCSTPYREVFFNVGKESQTLFYLIALGATIVLILGFLRLARIWMVGKQKLSFGQWIGNLQYVLKDGFFNRRIFKDDRYAGIMHFSIMSGFIVLFIGTVILTIHDREIFFKNGFLYGDLYLIYSFVMDFFGIVLLIGTIMALYRRYIEKHHRMRSNVIDGAILLALLVIGSSGIIIESLRIVASGFPRFEVFSFAGYILARILSLFNLTTENLRQIHFLTWWGHALAVEFGLAVFPFTKLAHVGVAPFNMLLREVKPFGRLSTSLEPIKTVKDMTIGQLVSLDSCMECRRCTVVCPAVASGGDNELDPMMIIQSSKAMAHKDYPYFFKKRGPTVIPGSDLVTANALWSCTNCMACVENCPVWIPHVDIIDGMRGALIEEGTKVPDTVAAFLESVLQNKNEWGEPKKNRMNWSKDLTVPEIKDNHAPLLYYVGCTNSYDPRNQKVARTFVRILQAAGVQFGVLGVKEQCTGDAVRRVGEEALFQELATTNIQLFKDSGAKRIVTTSPHSLNAIKNEYPEFGGDFDVVHHTQLIWELIQKGKIKFTNEVPRTITYHDPCYLGRYNGIIDTPRSILKRIPSIKLIEMPRNGRQSFCCGGGGGRMFMESGNVANRPSEIRTREAQETKASDLVVACPWCMSMLEDANKTTGSSMNVVEIVELVAEAMGIKT